MTVSYTLTKHDIQIPKNFPWSGVFEISKLCVIAKDDGKFVGACGLRGLINVLSIYVAMEYRSKGIGRSLLRNMIINAKKQNYLFITLAVG